MLRVPIQLKLDGAPDAAALEDLRLPVPGDGPVTLSRPGPGLWQLAVQDQGHGIPEAQREAVFAPFHRLSAAGPGAGLGLAVAREVMRQHGGRAFMGDGPGACVVLEFPVEG